MLLREFKERVFSLAEKEGFSEFEIYYSKSDDLSINVYETELEKYSVSSDMGVSFRGIYNGKMGYSYTENLDEAAVEMLVNSAKDSAVSIENEDEEFIYDGKDTYSKVKGFNEALAEVSADEKIKLALELERVAREKSERVVNLSFCSAGSTEEECGIMNSKGVDVSFKSNHLFAAVVPVVSDGSRMYNGISFRVGRDLSEVNAAGIAEEAVDEALSCIGASSIESGVFKIALRNDAAATMLATFAGAFSAENAQKGLSLLKGKSGQKIAADIVSIVDNPLMEQGLKSSPFDAEGVATYKKDIVERGTLTTLLYNLKTAAKDGVKTTGNAAKTTYSSPVTVAPTNFYIETGHKSFKEIVAYVGEGLLITDLAGTHSGANPVTGEFSLAAKGFVIENGEVGRPVEQITIAGNFFKLLENIEEIGNDLKFDMPSGSGYFGSPTIAVRDISVAGN
jgi:PmbA protein